MTSNDVFALAIEITTGAGSDPLEVWVWVTSLTTVTLPVGVLKDAFEPESWRAALLRTYQAVLTDESSSD